MKIVVTGLGAHCALGSNTETLWRAIKKGESGIKTITRFDVTPFDTHLGGMVATGNSYNTNELRLLKYASIAATEALERSGGVDRRHVALVLGTSNGLMGEKIYNVSYELAEDLKLGGMVFTFSTACTSSAHAIGFAAELIKRGHADLVLTGGVDILTLDAFAGFHSLGLLSKTPCAPFSRSIGTTLGEGAAFLLLETKQSAYLRGIKPIAAFLGYGISADAFHDTKPDPSGSGVTKAINLAFNDAGLLPGAIDYVNAHGTGTAANDSAEWQGIQRAFGTHAQQLPVSSSKSFLGHAQGAAGALEAVTTLISMNHNVIPPTLNYSNPRPNSPTDPVATQKPRSHAVKYALVTNSGFGGINSALIFGKAAEKPIPETKLPRPISIDGLGINLENDCINQYIPEGELRGLDRSARLLTGAVAMTLTDAGIRFRSNMSEGIGLFVGQENLSQESVESFETSIKDRGIKHLSALAFTRMVVNYPTGVCCRLFGLKGPIATMAAKPDSGLTALFYSADYLAWRNDTNFLLAASVNEHDAPNDNKAGAASILLKAGDDNASINLRGWAIAKDSETATKKALVMACLKATEVTQLDISTSHANPGLYSLIYAINDLKNNNSGPFLLKCHNENFMGIAMIVEKRF